MYSNIHFLTFIYLLPFRYGWIKLNIAHSSAMNHVQQRSNLFDVIWSIGVANIANISLYMLVFIRAALQKLETSTGAIATGECF
jgi:hypothetical protein